MRVLSLRMTRDTSITTSLPLGSVSTWVAIMFFAKDIELPVFVPEHMVEFGLGVVTEASNEVFNIIDEAKAAAMASSQQPAIAYFLEPQPHQVLRKHNAVASF
jgi:hypothetical protein